MSEDMPLLLRVGEVAKLLNVSRSKAYELIAQNVLPGVVRLGGGSIRVRRFDLETWVANLNQESEAAWGFGGRPPAGGGERLGPLNGR
jgi:excisionase family DNA binding protein